MIVDPFDDNRALDSDGVVMGAVRWLPTSFKVSAPSLQELQDAPIIGYARPMCFTCGNNDCEHAKRKP